MSPTDRRTRTGDGLDLAQFVWVRAVSLAGPSEREDLFRLALDLLRTARHDPATLVHASVVGDDWVRSHPTDSAAGLGAALLDRVVSFLGLRPRHPAVVK